MHWQDESDGFGEFVIESLDLADTAIIFSGVRDRVEQLFPEEQDELEPMAPKRKAGFSSGRWCAHRAQETLGLMPTPVHRENRAPVWPNGLNGSITHTDQFAGAIVSRNHAVGIDLEQLDRLHDGLHKTLFTENELELLGNYDQNADTIMFSAKEAGYKAVFPIGQEFIGFHEAEIHLNENAQTFIIDYIGEHNPNEILKTGRGYWRIAHDHVFTLFVISS